LQKGATVANAYTPLLASFPLKPFYESYALSLSLRELTLPQRNPRERNTKGLEIPAGPLQKGATVANAYTPLLASSPLKPFYESYALSLSLRELTLPQRNPRERNMK